MPALIYSTVQFTDFIPLFQGKHLFVRFYVPMVVPVKTAVYLDVEDG